MKKISIKRWREALMNDELFERVVWLEQGMKESESENEDKKHPWNDPVYYFGLF